MAKKQREPARIDDAIAHYNLNVKGDNAEPMTRKTLAPKVFSKARIGAADMYFSQWQRGNEMTALTDPYIRKICAATGVDANFLLMIKPMEK